MFSNGSTAMLLSDALGFGIESWVCNEREIKNAETPRIRRAAAARATRLRLSWFASGEQRSRRDDNSFVPGRDAGCKASIDLSNDLSGEGTWAVFSCSTGSTCDCCAR